MKWTKFLNKVNRKEQLAVSILERWPLKGKFEYMFNMFKRFRGLGLFFNWFFLLEKKPNNKVVSYKHKKQAKYLIRKQLGKEGIKKQIKEFTEFKGI